MIGRVLAFVTRAEGGRFSGPQHVEGWILHASGEFDDEAAEAAHNLSDCHGVPLPPRTGLLVFEGWIEWHGAPDDAEPEWMGQWRPLDFWELCKLREGQLLFDDDEIASGSSGKASPSSDGRTS